MNTIPPPAVPVLPLFHGWLARVKLGESAAVGELVAVAMPILRRVVRHRLVRLKLLRVVDPMDVCQATLANFFGRVSGSWPPVESPEQLRALLLVIARNKIQDEVRRHTADRRDHRRIRSGHSGEHMAHLEAPDPSPSHQVARSELYHQALRRLTKDERQLLEERLAGQSWAAIAAAHGQPVDLLRQKLNRAVKRVRRQLIIESRQTNDEVG